MAQTPLADMADKGYDNMSEESGYILNEMKAYINALERHLDYKEADKSEMIQRFNYIEGRLDRRDPDLIAAVNFIENKIKCLDDYYSGLHVLAAQVGSLKNAILNLSAKLDGEDVTNLDTDYNDGVIADLASS